MTKVSNRFLIIIGCAWLALICRADATETAAPPYQVLISVPDQKLAVVCGGQLVARFPVSTSRFGTGDNFGSYKTPLGALRVCDKIGDNLEPGAVIRHRSATGEVLPVNAPGRDPIVTRVIWLDGLEDQNKNAHSRGIYIHGTPEERTIGTPASYGCIRMRSRDVIKVFDAIPVGTVVSIIPARLPHMRRYEPPREQPAPESQVPPAPVSVPEVAPGGGMPAPSASGGKPEDKPKPQPLPERPMEIMASSTVAPLLPPIGEAPQKSNVAALRMMKGSILLANMPGDRRNAKNAPQ